MRTLSRRFGWFALLCLVVLVGCAGGTSALEALLGSQASSTVDQLLANTLVIRIVNQTNNTEELTIVADGIEQTASCSSLLQVCDAYLPTCPQRVEAIRDRQLDSQGRFMGGHEFNGNPAYIFDRSQFECGQFIIFQFDANGNVSAFVL